ncbi:MAG: 50S ribosomal protein L32 [Waddliaceae bacterium]
MAVPRSRLSNQRKNKRRSHHAKSPKQLQGCSNCGTQKPSHVICASCGTYAGRQIFAKDTEE